MVGALTRSVDTTHDEASDWTPKLTNLPAFTRSVPHYMPPRQTTTTSTPLSDTQSLDTSHEEASSSITSLGSNLTRRQQPMKPSPSTRSVPHYAPPKQTPNMPLSNTQPLDTTHEETGSSTTSPRSDLSQRRQQPMKPPASTRSVPHLRQTQTRTTVLPDITPKPSASTITPRTTNPLISPPPQPSNNSPPSIIPLEVQPHSPPPPNKASLKAWWEQFSFTNSPKTDSFRGPHGGLSIHSFFLINRLTDMFSTRRHRSSGLRETSRGESALRQCPNIHSKCQWRALRLGLHSCCHRKMVSPFFSLVFFSSSPCIVASISKKTARSYSFAVSLSLTPSPNSNGSSRCI